MINAYFVNSCIMLTLVAVSYHFFSIFESRLTKHPVVFKFIIGLIGGAIGIILMLNAVKVEQNIILDFRNIIVILCAIFGGPIAALVAAGVIATARVGFFGLATSSVVAVMSIFTIAIGTSVVSRIFHSFRMKWFVSFGINLAVSIMALHYVLASTYNFDKILSVYVVGTTIMTVFLYGIVAFYISFHSNFAKLTAESTTDFLTGINNVRAFDIEFNKAISHCARKNEHLTFIILDIDFFKKVNDTYGHASGDKVLKQLADLLVDTCRVFDVISRNGGEEFSVILQDCPSSHALQVAERIRRAVEIAAFKINQDRSVRITVSIGLASYPDHSDNPEALIGFADKALYQAKQSGRNKVVQHECLEQVAM